MPRPEERVVHIHLYRSEGTEALLGAVHDLTAAVEQLGEQMATDLSRLTTEVEETRTVIDSAVALIANLAQLLRDAASAPDVTAEVNALADSLDAKQAELAAAVEANTPAAPEPPA